MLWHQAKASYRALSSRDVAEAGRMLRARGFQITERKNMLWATKAATPA